MNQDVLIELSKLEKLLEDKIVLLESLVLATQNALLLISNSKIEEFCTSLDVSEKFINRINEIDNMAGLIINSFNGDIYKNINKMYMMFDIEKTPPDFEETGLPLNLKAMYGYLNNKYGLLKVFLKLNEELKSRSQTTVLSIKENLKVLNEKKQVNLKYKTILSNTIE